ncbi:MAG: SLBB domain-containing protein [Candidatus Eremiobacteraeota bacterium]|nr:SLBB domain-containing protein [Candidatus Eremiobacteraeota bacterium]
MEIWNHIPGSLRVFFLIFLFFLFLVTGLLLYPKVRTVKEPVEVVLTPKAREVTIYITGMIKKPGVYTLKKGERVINAIKKAGGPLKGWDPERINLARRLDDQEMIVVPGEKKSLWNDSHSSNGRNFNKRNWEKQKDKSKGRVKFSYWHWKKHDWEKHHWRKHHWREYHSSRWNRYYRQGRYHDHYQRSYWEHPEKR